MGGTASRAWHAVACAALVAAVLPALPVAAATPTAFQVEVNGQAVPGPAPVVSGQVMLPVAGLAKVLGARVSSASGGTIALATGDGSPPDPILASPAAVLLDSADVGPGYALGSYDPSRSAVPEPPGGPARIGVASEVFLQKTAKALKKLPASARLAPAVVAVTVAEYSSVPAAASAEATLFSPTDQGVGWAALPGPYARLAVTNLPGPLGESYSLWSGDNGQAWLLVARAQNWVVVSVVGPSRLDQAWSLWLEQIHRIEDIPPTGAPRGPAPSGAQSAALPATDLGPLAVTLNQVPLGTATWSRGAYVLPAGEAEMALALTPERTRANGLNLQGTSLVDNGTVPAVLARPQTVVLTPQAFWPIPFDPILGNSESNASLSYGSATVAFDFADWGRLGGYQVEYGTSPKDASLTGLPEAVLIGLDEFSTAAGAYTATQTYRGSMRSLVKGATVLPLGDLNGPHGNGPVYAVHAEKVIGKTVYAYEYYLVQVDNWEVLVGVAGPVGSYTPRAIWPYLTALANEIQLDAQPSP